MMIRSTVFLCSTLFALPLVALATPRSQSAVHADVDPGAAKGSDPRKTPLLADLDAEMHRTGKIAVPDLRGEPIPTVATSQPPEAAVDSVSAASPQKPATWVSVRDNPTLDAQYGPAFAASVGACRFVVAQQLGVSAVDVEAGIVTFRWTIDPSGRVRVASMVAESPTNEAVMVCAKRVVVSRVLLNAVDKPLALEWTYAFRKIAVPVGNIALAGAAQ
jgi:hypothetical protein